MIDCIHVGFQSVKAQPHEKSKANEERLSGMVYVQNYSMAVVRC